MRWLLYTLLLSLPSFLPAQSWYLEPEPLPCITNKLYFCSPDTGFIFGLYDEQYRSSDGGKSWDFFALPQSASITQVHFPTAQQGYIAGSLEQSGAGVVWRSTDSGLSWESVTPPGAQAIQTMRFANAHRGICVDAQGLLFLTENAGNDWTIQDTLQGVANQALWLDDSVCLMSGRVPSATLRPRLSRSADGGQTWSYYNLPINNSETITLAQISATELSILFTPRYTGSSNRWLYSSDKGLNWLLEELPVQAASDFTFSDSQTAWFCSRSGSIYQSSDRANSIQLTYSSELEWRSLQMLSPYRGYALGGFDRLLRWQAPKPEASPETFKLWPNPAAVQQEVQLRLPATSQLLQVYNSLGQSVAQHELQGQRNWTLRLEQGLYHIVVKGTDWTETRSLIIQ